MKKQQPSRSSSTHFSRRLASESSNPPPPLRTGIDSRYGKFVDTRIDAAEVNKLRGGYYTAPNIAQWICRWGIRRRVDRILEPSFGDGAFVESAAKRLHELGASPSQVLQQLTGIEIFPGEVRKARSRLSSLLGGPPNGSLQCGDFFRWLARSGDSDYDFAGGNPPFIRYQSIPEPSRSLAMALLQNTGLKPNKLTNIWVPFVVGCVTKLRTGGRLGLVLPAELLQVFYAAQLRSFLIREFETIQIFSCNDLIFEGAEQEVVLLLADGKREVGPKDSSCDISLKESRSAEGILSRPAPVKRRGLKSAKTLDHENEKWLKYFLSKREISFMRALRRAPEIASLAQHASVDVGVVTGKNEFFVLSKAEATSLGLERYVVPIVSKASQLQGARITEADLRSSADGGQKVFLLDLKSGAQGSFSEEVKSYLRRGEEQGYHLGYKCAIRKPWYVVPEAWLPTCFFFRQIYDFPRVVLNRAGATSTDTIHRMRCSENPERLTKNLYNHLIAASAEIEGRSYGGGVLELEPTEAERLLVPRSLGEALPLSEVDRLVRAGRLGEVLAANDRIVLRNGVGLSAADCCLLRGIWEKMRNRRLERRRNGRG